MPHARMYLVFSSLVFLASCTSTSPRNPASSDPNSFDSLLNFDLSEGEVYKGGSKSAELAGFAADVHAVQKSSSELFSKYAKQSRSGRVFHEKSHGCLTGTMKILADRPKDPEGKTFVGFFKAPAEYPFVSRFSNGIGFNEHDAHADVRGVAFKVFGNDADGPVDFLLANNTNPFARDQAQFVEFMKANNQGGVAPIKFAIEQQRAQTNPAEFPYLRLFARGTAGNIESPVRERYWSGHPYMFGKDRHMKFNVYPVNWSPQDQLDFERRGEGLTGKNAVTNLAKKADNRLTKNRNYLRQVLKAASTAGPIKYIFAVQLEKDAVTTPLENALIEWKEVDAPSIPVAEITFDQQDFDNPERDQECAQLRFTPAHYHHDHRPVGNMGRGRIFTYLASQRSRPSNPQHPDVSLVERWRNGNYLVSAH